MTSNNIVIKIESGSEAANEAMLEFLKEMFKRKVLTYSDHYVVNGFVIFVDQAEVIKQSNYRSS